MEAPYRVIWPEGDKRLGMLGWIGLIIVGSVLYIWCYGRERHGHRD